MDSKEEKTLNTTLCIAILITSNIAILITIIIAIITPTHHPSLSHFSLLLIVPVTTKSFHVINLNLGHVFNDNISIYHYAGETGWTEEAQECQSNILHNR